MTPTQHRLLVVASSVVVVAVAAYALGQGRGQGPMYNAATETTIKGTVESVETIAGGGAGRGRRGLGGIHVTIKSGTEMVQVHLGPAAYMAEQKLTMAAGDSVEIIGSRVTLDGEAVLIAKSVTKSGMTYTLRDASGRPLWSGGAAR